MIIAAYWKLIPVTDPKTNPNASGNQPNQLFNGDIISVLSSSTSLTTTFVSLVLSTFVSLVLSSFVSLVLSSFVSLVLSTFGFHKSQISCVNSVGFSVILIVPLFLLI